MMSDQLYSPYYIYIYFSNLVNAFYKILPMAENKEKSRVEYMGSLLRELLGMQKMAESVEYDTGFLSLLNILRYLLDHADCNPEIVKQDVFKAISICNRLANKYQTISATEVSHERVGKV